MQSDSFLSGFPHVLWINLDRCTVRRKYMNTLLDSNSIQHTRIRAIDGAVFQDLCSVCIPNARSSPGENGCTASHLVALKYFLQNMTDDVIAIFEDDISFDFLPLLPFNWKSFYADLPNDWDVVQLAIMHEGKINHELVLNTHPYNYYCSVAYIITRNGAKKILDQFPIKNNRFDLSTHQSIQADVVLYRNVKTFSIPMFSYKTQESIIHHHHLIVHMLAKKEQLEMWEKISRIKNLDVK